MHGPVSDITCSASILHNRTLLRLADHRVSPQISKWGHHFRHLMIAITQCCWYFDPFRQLLATWGVQQKMLSSGGKNQKENWYYSTSDANTAKMKIKGGGL